MNVSQVSLSIKINEVEYQSKAKAVSIEEDIRNAPYGSASIELELETPEFVTGDFVRILGSDDSAFFGIIRSITQTKKVLPNGIKITHISLFCLSWAYLLLRGEFKQTLNRDLGDIQKVDESAIFEVGDYNSGILSVLREELEKQSNPAKVLGDFILQLCHYKLPNGSRLGDFIKVYNGNDFSGAIPYENVPRDEIKGVLLTQFKGAYVNNMSHWAIVNQLFNTLPSLFELFCITTKAEFFQYDMDGVQLSIIFRYKPLNPLVFDYSQYKIFTEFFGGDQPTQIPILDENEITEFRFSFDEEDHVNMVFIENPFTNADAHNANMFRNNNLPILDVDDINKRGLRSFSATTPFVSAKGTTSEIKRQNLQIHNALAQRAFLTFGLGSRFCRGTITHTPVSTPPLKVGQWVQIKEGTFYIIGVRKSYTISPEGILRVSYLYTFERGSFENEIAEFDEPNFPEEDNSTKRPFNTKLKDILDIEHTVPEEEDPLIVTLTRIGEEE